MTAGEGQGAERLPDVTVEISQANFALLPDTARELLTEQARMEALPMGRMAFTMSAELWDEIEGMTQASSGLALDDTGEPEDFE